MYRKHVSWISLLAFVLAVTALPAVDARAAEPTADTEAASFWRLDLDLLQWLDRGLSIVLEAFSDEGEEPEESDEPVDEPPTAEVGPGMVPIG